MSLDFEMITVGGLVKYEEKHSEGDRDPGRYVILTTGQRIDIIQSKMT